MSDVISTREFYLTERRTVELIRALSRVMKNDNTLYDGMTIDTSTVFQNDKLLHMLKLKYMTRENGFDSMMHFVSVALRVPPTHIASYHGTLVTCALFHDYYEDFSEPDPIIDNTIGLHPYLKPCLELLTRNDEVGYFDYIKTIANRATAYKDIVGITALIIKLLDNLENQYNCLKLNPNPSLLTRYIKAFHILEEAAQFIYNYLANPLRMQGDIDV